MAADEVWTIHTDGAARGNPGPAACAYIIRRGTAPPLEESACLGETTNNIAEYTALVRALQRAAELGGKWLHIHSDSELLVKQMNGEYRVKDPDLRVLYEQAKQLTAGFEKVTLTHVRRNENSDADRLCNQALDGGGRAKAPAPAKKKAKAPTGREEAVREEALTCLRGAAAAWARGNPADPSPEAIWEQLWSVLEDHRVLRR